MSETKGHARDVITRMRREIIFNVLNMIWLLAVLAVVGFWLDRLGYIDIGPPPKPPMEFDSPEQLRQWGEEALKRHLEREGVVK